MKKWISVALIGLMFLSSLAFAGIQSLYGGFGGTNSPAAQSQEEAQLPSQAVIDYSLSPPQFNLAISRGVTVATYSYDKNCIECANERQFVESLALSREFQNQIVLEEIQRSGKSSLKIQSFLGSRTLEKIGQNETIKAFCDLVVSPPVGCVLR